MSVQSNPQITEPETKVIRANEGSQDDFVSCPLYEALYHGTRGPGKSFALLLAFLVYVGKGFGQHYSGYIIRRQYSELEEIRDQCNELFSDAYKKRFRYKKAEDQFYLPGGERLKLSHAEKLSDYWKFHGKARPYLAWDELVSWPTLALYERMKSICRSKNPKIPLRIRSTTNSLGPGHNAVKSYFKLASLPFGSVITNSMGLKRTNIWGAISENPYLFNNKTYVKFLMSQRDPNVRKSWLLGSWDIVAGGALSDVFRTDVHIMETFKIPKDWNVYRCLDWGSARPYCVLWIAESDGSDFVYRGKTRQSLKGDLFAISELYGIEIDSDGNYQANVGTKETPTQVRDKIIKRERKLIRYHGINRIYAGTADSAIYAQTRGSKEKTIADLFKPVNFQPSVKGKGSRSDGLEIVRDTFSGSIPDRFGYREHPGMFFFNTCTHTLRTVPVLPRDETKVEDIDKNAEDHAFDTIKYFVRKKKLKTFVLKQ